MDKTDEYIEKHYKLCKEYNLIMTVVDRDGELAAKPPDTRIETIEDYIKEIRKNKEIY